MIKIILKIKNHIIKIITSSLILFSFMLLFVRNSWSIDSSEAQTIGYFIIMVSKTLDQNSRLCVLGNDEVSVSIKNQIDAYQISQNFKNVDKCKTVYIAKDQARSARNSIPILNKNRILTIGMIENFKESGGMITVQIGRRNFELIANYEEIKAAEIKIDPVLMELIINKN